MIIGLLGKKGSGKSLAASVFEAHDFTRLSFAGPLKEIVHEAFNIPMFKLTDAQAKEEATVNVCLNALAVKQLLDVANGYLPITEAQYANALEKAPNTVLNTPRAVLQHVGTEIFRNLISDTFWLDLMTAKLKATPNAVIDDIRFPNELQLVQALGGTTIAIHRPGLQSSDLHASESLYFDNANYYITNKFSIEDFKCSIGTIYEELQWLETHGKQKTLKSFEDYLENKDQK